MDIASDFDLLALYRRLLARWPVIFAAGFLAGMAGFAVAELRPPVYEATAVIEIGIDRSRALVPDDITVRQAHDRVRALLLADDTLQAAISLAGSPPATSATFRESIRLSERPDGWQLAVLGAAKEDVERQAQAWAEASLSQISSASLHALRAAEWQKVLYEASCRLMTPEEGSESAVWLCRSAPPGGADAIPSSILAEVVASRGILPVFSYSLMQGSRGTARLVLWGRGFQVIGGSVVGLLAGAILVAFRKRPGIP